MLYVLVLVIVFVVFEHLAQVVVVIRLKVRLREVCDVSCSAFVISVVIFRSSISFSLELLSFKD